MKTRLSTEEAVAGLLAANCGALMTARERHIYREALHALVRLAKSELMAEMRSNVKKLTATSSRAREKTRHAAAPRQQQFEFHQHR